MNAASIGFAGTVAAFMSVSMCGFVSSVWAEEQSPTAESAPAGEPHEASPRTLSVRGHVGLVPDMLGLEVNVALPMDFEVEFTAGCIPPMPDFESYSGALRAGYALYLDRNNEGWELLLPAQMGYRYLHASGYTGYQGPSEVVSHGVEVLFGLEVLYWLEDGGAFDLRASMGYTHFFGEDAQWFFGNPTLSVGAAF